MPRAGTLLRLTAVTVVFGATLLLPVTAPCEVATAAVAVRAYQPSLTLDWGSERSRCDLTVTGRVTEQGRLRLSARLVCSAAQPAERRVGPGSAKL